MDSIHVIVFVVINICINNRVFMNAKPDLCTRPKAFGSHRSMRAFRCAPVRLCPCNNNNNINNNLCVRAVPAEKWPTAASHVAKTGGFLRTTDSTLCETRSSSQRYYDIHLYYFIRFLRARARASRSRRDLSQRMAQHWLATHRPRFSTKCAQSIRRRESLATIRFDPDTYDGFRPRVAIKNTAESNRMDSCHKKTINIGKRHSKIIARIYLGNESIYNLNFDN